MAPRISVTGSGGGVRYRPQSAAGVGASGPSVTIAPAGPPEPAQPPVAATPTNAHKEGDPVTLANGSQGVWHWHAGSAHFPADWLPLPPDPASKIYQDFPELQYDHATGKSTAAQPSSGSPRGGADIPPKGPGPSVAGGVPFPVAQAGQPPKPAAVQSQNPKPDDSDPDKSDRSSRSLTLPSGYIQDYIWTWNPGQNKFIEAPVGQPRAPGAAAGRDPAAQAVDVAQAGHISAQTQQLQIEIANLLRDGSPASIQKAQQVLDWARMSGYLPTGEPTLDRWVAETRAKLDQARLTLDTGQAVGHVGSEPTVQAGIAVGNVLGQPTLDAINSQIGTWSQRANDALARGQFDEARYMNRIVNALNERKFNLDADVQGEQSHRADIATNLAVQNQEFTQADALRNSYRNDQDLALRAQGQGFNQMRGNREDYRADVDQALKGQGQQFAQDDALRLGYRADQAEQRAQQGQDYTQQMERRKFASELAQNPASYLQYAALAAGKDLPAGVGLFDALARTGPDVISTSDWMKNSGLTGPSAYRYGQNTPTALGYLDQQSLRQPSTDRFGANHISVDDYLRNQGLSAPATYTYGKNVPSTLGYLNDKMGSRAVANTPIGSGNYPKGPDPVITPTAPMPPGELPKPPRLVGPGNGL